LLSLPGPTRQPHYGTSFVFFFISVPCARGICGGGGGGFPRPIFSFLCCASSYPLDGEGKACIYIYQARLSSRNWIFLREAQESSADHREA
uniref:Uncharacterized protein n=1 Tax=Triticum urartu TaxID=4572 RepID=A0A8R7P2P4_TRIUA